MASKNYITVKIIKTTRKLLKVSSFTFNNTLHETFSAKFLILISLFYLYQDIEFNDYFEEHVLMAVSFKYFNGRQIFARLFTLLLD